MIDGAWIPFAAGAGGLGGGVVNCLLTDGGFSLPLVDRTEGGPTLFAPGCLGTFFIGVMAALVNWGLNSIGGTAHTGSAAWGVFASATFAGLAGSRFFSHEVEKAVDRAADQILANEGYEGIDPDLDPGDTSDAADDAGDSRPPPPLPRITERPPALQAREGNPPAGSSGTP